MKPTLKIGLASGSITPEGKISLCGQFFTRISKYVKEPLLANCVVMERGEEQLILCACDLEGVGRSLYLRAAELVEARHPEIDADAMMLFATHTHCGPAGRFTYEVEDSIACGLRAAFRYLPEGYSYRDEAAEEPGYLEQDDAAEQVAQGIANTICEAWEKRAEGSFGGAFGRAALGHCRRPTYLDGTAKMYGPSDTAAFVALEGGNDSGVELLYFFDAAGKPTGALVNVACPSQIEEVMYYVTPDYWGRARAHVKETLGEDFVLVGMCAPAGDQAPRDQVRKSSRRPGFLPRRSDSDIMYEAAGAEYYGRMVADVVVDRLSQGEENRKTDGYLETKLVHLELPVRKVSPTQYLQAKRSFREALEDLPTKVLTPDNCSPLYLAAGDMYRYEMQEEHATHPIDVVVARLDDMAFASSPFELYLDYGNQMRARSRAAQTFLAQLCNGEDGYLPTEKGEKGGHYSAFVASGIVGHEGGAMLTEATIQTITDLFAPGTDE